MSLQLVHHDITRMHVDVIVNAANSRLEMGGGVCGAIFQRAGIENMKRACAEIGSCRVGEAVITEGFSLPAQYVIHTVGPVWRGGTNDEALLLERAYRRSLQLAHEKGLQTIAFPLISSGIYGYPKREALDVAKKAIQGFLRDHEMTVYLVLFDRAAIELSKELEKEIVHFIDTYYEEPRRRIRSEEFIMYKEQLKLESQELFCKKLVEEELESSMLWDEILPEIEETFVERLFRLIDEKGKTDVEVYKGANIDRKLFSKIRSNKNYQPKKETTIALAISLQLSLEEAEDLLERAGFALSMSQKFDVIIRYFLEKELYDMFTINETLFRFEQKLLGS